MGFNPERLDDPELREWLSGLLWEFEGNGMSPGDAADLILETVRKFCEQSRSYRLPESQTPARKLENP